MYIQSYLSQLSFSSSHLYTPLVFYTLFDFKVLLDVNGISISITMLSITYDHSALLSSAQHCLWLFSSTQHCSVLHCLALLRIAQHCSKLTVLRNEFLVKTKIDVAFLGEFGSAMTLHVLLKDVHSRKRFFVINFPPIRFSFLNDILFPLQMPEEKYSHLW